MIREEEQLKLNRQVCFPLYALSREITNVYRPILEELNITYPQYLVLMVLWEEEPCTVNQIGEKLRLDSGTLTPLLKRLEAKGLLSRQRKSCDERVVEIQLTPQGLDLKNEAVKVPERVSEKLGLSREELEQLKKITKTILNKIQ